MRTCILFIALLVISVATISPAWPQSMPKIANVEPDTGKIGDELSANGENLDKASVAELFLTDGKTDWKVPVTQQTAKFIKFKIPPQAKAGRFALMVMTAGADPKLIEQPVKVTIE